jgi:3',5'-cyclic AMP phosphodiesterase CpdA
MKERTRLQHELQILTNIEGELENISSDQMTQVEEETSIKTGHIQARILWPALGFPSVIAPNSNDPNKSRPEGDATVCICILLLSNREHLSAEDAARYIRFVPWEKRHFGRHIPYSKGKDGTFLKEDLKVIKPQEAHPNDNLNQVVQFGANQKGENGVLATLPKQVRQFYRNTGLRFLHEIRVNHTASGKISKGLYHIFWNNQATSQKTISDELGHLITHFAIPRRQSLGNLWKRYSSLLKNEYEYEYGSLHLPYKLNHGGPGQNFQTEILHPLFIIDQPSVLRISHLTDIHVDTRADVYEENLRASGSKHLLDAYNNWNKNFQKIYTRAKSDSDLLLLTGDLIDYGRGFIGVEHRQELANDDLYNVDRNWFLFYYLLASNLGRGQSQYSKPVYTCLGNHDWRLNPYPPFAFAGAPSPEAIFDKDVLKKRGLDKPANMKAFLEFAHGSGHDLLLSYQKSLISKWQRPLESAKGLGNSADLVDALKRLYTVSKAAITDKDKLLFKLLKGDSTIDVRGFPTETNIESVEWYLFAINPFLNYQFTLPGGYELLMLDWEKEEDVIFDAYSKGKNYGWGFSTDEGPKARNSLTSVQKKLIERLLKSNGKTKIIGIHAPPIGPWPDWYDDELIRGWNEFDYDGRGAPYYKATFTEGNTKITKKGHPFFAFKPKKGVVKDAVYGMDASFGSIVKDRDWFIKQMANQKFNIRLVLSGHIHRQGLFVTSKSNVSRESTLYDELLVKGIDPIKVSGLPSTNGKPNRFGQSPGPLYVNSTSIGPRGHLYPFQPEKGSRDDSKYISPGYTYLEVSNSGVIPKVTFRRL